MVASKIPEIIANLKLMTFVQKLISKIENVHSLYLITILVIIPLIIYFPSLFNSFVWDDEEQIVNNTIIQNLSNIPSLFTSSTFNTGGAGLSGFYYKPLMSITFSINYLLWKTNPFGYHLFDLTLHAINGVLVFILLRKFFNLQKIPYSKTLTFLLSIIFIVHPANTESVAYISSTQELLYTFFLISTLLLAFNFIEKKGKSIKLILFINISILLSLLSKESGIVAIPLVVIFTYLYFRPKFTIITLSSSITFIIYLILRFAVAKTPMFQHNSIVPISNASFLNRLTTIPFELFSYFRLLFFPKDLFVTQYMVIENVSDPRFYINFIVVALILSFLIFAFLKNRSKLYLFFFSWIFLSFFLLLNIYPLDMTIAERWLYGPMIGVLGLLGILIHDIFGKNKKTTTHVFIPFVLIAFFISIFSIRTFTRTFDWQNNLTLFSHDEIYSKNSFDLQNNLGVALFRNGDLKNAKIHFEKSITLSPKWWISYNNLGVIYQREGNLKQAEKLYEESIKNGNYYLAYENLVGIKYKTEEPKEIIPFLEDSLNRLPYNETLNRIAALTFYQIGATKSAKLYAQRAFLINKSQENYLLIRTIMDIK